MRSGVLALIAASFLCTSAQAVPLQGNKVTVAGRAHIQKEAAGTHIYLGGPGSIGGVVPFDDKSTFPGLWQLDGRQVQITGVVDSKQLITLTDPDQIKAVD